MVLQQERLADPRRFNKDLKDVIVNQLYNYDVQDTAGKTYSFLVTGPVNGAHGYARGFELAYQQFYDFLPGWLSGLRHPGELTLRGQQAQAEQPGVLGEYCSGGDGAANLNLYVNGCDTDGTHLRRPAAAGPVAQDGQPGDHVRKGSAAGARWPTTGVRATCQA
jgi:hypothetical protein